MDENEFNVNTPQRLNATSVSSVTSRIAKYIDSQLQGRSVVILKDLHGLIEKADMSDTSVLNALDFLIIAMNEDK